MWKLKGSPADLCLSSPNLEEELGRGPERERINSRIQEILDSQTDPWGIKVVLVELKHINFAMHCQEAIRPRFQKDQLDKMDCLYTRLVRVDNQHAFSAVATFNLQANDQVVLSGYA